MSENNNYFQNISIKTDGAFTHVFIDGKEIKGIIEISFEHHTGGLATVDLTMNTMDLTIDGLVALKSKDYPDEEMIFVPKDIYKKMELSKTKSPDEG